jgi:opacity protein-like surface antigen
MKGRKTGLWGALLGLVLMTAMAPGAWALGMGSSMFAIELTSGTADVADRSSLGGLTYITASDHSETGVQGQYWYLMSDDYAVTVSAGIGFFSEEDKYDTTATTAFPNRKYSISSYNLRVGGDRVVKLGERTVMYGGPGIEYWSGKEKFKKFGGALDDYEGESTTRIGLSARLGAVMSLSDMVGITAHVGHRIGYASVEDKKAKATWWPSSFEGSMGIVFSFGGSK